MNNEDSNMAANAICHAAHMASHSVAESFSKYSSWAVVYRLIPFRDGNEWCVLLGADIQVGIAGFGKTPAEAIYDFDDSMNNQKVLK